MLAGGGGGGAVYLKAQSVGLEAHESSLSWLATDATSADAVVNCSTTLGLSTRFVLLMGWCRATRGSVPRMSGPRNRKYPQPIS